MVERTKPRIIASWDSKPPVRREPASAFFVAETRLMPERTSGAFGPPTRYATKIRVARIPSGERAAGSRPSPTQGFPKRVQRLLVIGFGLWAIGGAALWLSDETLLSGWLAPLKATPFLGVPVLLAAVAAWRPLRWLPERIGPQVTARRCAGAAAILTGMSLVFSAWGLTYLYAELFAEWEGLGGLVVFRLTIDGLAASVLFAGCAVALLLWSLPPLSEGRPRLLSRLLALLPVFLCGWVALRYSFEYFLFRVTQDPWGGLLLPSGLRSSPLALFVAAGLGLAAVLLVPVTMRTRAPHPPGCTEPIAPEAETMRTW